MTVQKRCENYVRRRNSIGSAGCVAAVLCAAIAIASPAHAASVYTFEGLTSPADLAPQDNWVHSGTSGTPHIDVISGTNGSNVAVNTGPANAQFATRDNDGAFSIPGFTGNETDAYIQADFRFINSGNFWFHIRGTGNLSPGIGLIDDAPSGPSTPAFAVRKGGGGSNLYVAVTGADQGDWLRIRLTMDFTANGGDGFGDISYMNLTQGDLSFTSVAGLQNVDLDMSGVDATTFDALQIRTDLNVPQSQIDNLTVHVPEPNGCLLCVMGGGLLLMVLRRRQRDGSCHQTTVFHCADQPADSLCLRDTE